MELPSNLYYQPKGSNGFHVISKFVYAFFKSIVYFELICVIKFFYDCFSSIPRGTYYPMASSTAARSGFRTIFAKSYEMSLQIFACMSLQKALKYPSILFELSAFPPGLRVNWVNFTSRIFPSALFPQQPPLVVLLI